MTRIDRFLFPVMTVIAVIAFGISALELTSLSLAARAVVNGRPGLETAARLSPLNWSFRFVLGEVSAAAGRPELAAKWYAEALARNPACAQCAVGLAEVETRLGRDPDPWLRRAIRYGRSTASVRVRVGTLYARLGRRNEAAREFRAAALGQRENQREFFSLLHRIYPDDVVLEEIIPDQIIPAYFAFGCWKLTPLAMKRVWERYERIGLGSTSRDEYVAYLLRHGLAHEAWSVHFGGEAPPVGQVLHGGFEQWTESRPFSWRIADGEGVKAGIVNCDDCIERGHSLVVRFDGETNVHYAGVRLHVPTVSGATYRLSARVKGVGLSSAQGPTLTVLGIPGLEQDPTHACSFRVIGEALRGTFSWRTTSLLFTVPEACEGIQILVTRLRTKRLDKFIGGELWVDDVALEEVASSAPPTSSEPAQERALGSSMGAVLGALAAPSPPVQ